MARAGRLFHLVPIHHPATSQLWQPGDRLPPRPDHWACLWSLPALGSALGCVSRGDRLWGPQLSLEAVLASASPEETPTPGTPALIPTLCCPLPHHLLQPGGHSPAWGQSTPKQPAGGDGGL